MTREESSVEAALEALGGSVASMSWERLRRLWDVWNARRIEIQATAGPLRTWLPPTPEMLRPYCEGPVRVCWEIARQGNLPEDLFAAACEAFPYLVATENSQTPLWALSFPDVFAALAASAVAACGLPPSVSRLSVPTPATLRVALVDASSWNGMDLGHRAVMFYAVCAFRRGRPDPLLAAETRERGWKIWRLVRAICPEGETHPWFAVEVDRSCFCDPVLPPPPPCREHWAGRRLCGWGGT